MTSTELTHPKACSEQTTATQTYKTTCMHPAPNPIHSALIGLAVADALGVPVEFRSRAELKADPVNGMRAYGTYNQPAGTWSDDSSMAFCIAENLAQGYNLQQIAIYFINWKYHNYWTPHGELFDIGNQTSSAIGKLKNIIADGQGQTLVGLSSDDPMNNGNGSLMRCIPLLFLVEGKSSHEQFRIIREVSALTHGHIRSAIACYFYLLMAEQILKGKEKKSAYLAACQQVKLWMQDQRISTAEQEAFAKVLGGEIHLEQEENIQSSGYVMHSLEASLWCFLNYGDYASAVLAAVNLGKDTDTTAAITGGLAGLYYGLDLIPEDWINTIARLEDIYELADRVEKVYPRRSTS